MATILSVSAEPALLYTRGLVLERTGAVVESASPEQAVSLLKSSTYDVVILCHSLHGKDAQEVCNVARTSYRSSKVLLIESPLVSTHPPIPADYRVSLEDGPGFLISVAMRLLVDAATTASDRFAWSAAAAYSAPPEGSQHQSTPRRPRTAMRARSLLS